MACGVRTRLRGTLPPEGKVAVAICNWSDLRNTSIQFGGCGSIVIPCLESDIDAIRRILEGHQDADREDIDRASAQEANLVRLARIRAAKCLVYEVHEGEALHDREAYGNEMFFLQQALKGKGKGTFPHIWTAGRDRSVCEKLRQLRSSETAVPETGATEATHDERDAVVLTLPYGATKERLIPFGKTMSLLHGILHYEPTIELRASHPCGVFCIGVDG